jgi:uncharacterized membrane protein YidH (DUF202 family)
VDKPPTEPGGSTDLAAQRTYLAAERTMFAVMRTGLSVAGGGSLVITLLGDHWPLSVQVPLVVTFLTTGYTMTLLGLRRYRRLAAHAEQAGRAGLDIISSRAVTVVLVVLQVTIVIVVALFMASAFETT